VSYSLYDFTESLAGGTGINRYDRTVIAATDVKRVVAAWGYSPEGYGSWAGGFLMEMTDGRFAYLRGWCDTTGWGCQDGTEVTYFEAQPDLASLEKPSERSEYENEVPGDWDLEPADLNKWLADGAPDPYTF
jgi:hypothetical protein